MPPSPAQLRVWGWSEERIAAAYERDRLDEKKIREFLKSHPQAKMLDILDLLRFIWAVGAWPVVRRSWFCHVARFSPG